MFFTGLLEGFLESILRGRGVVNSFIDIFIRVVITLLLMLGVNKDYLLEPLRIFGFGSQCPYI